MSMTAPICVGDCETVLVLAIDKSNDWNGRKHNRFIKAILKDPLH